MVYNMIVGDVVRFLILYLCLLVGFTTAFYTLEVTTENYDNGLQTWFDRERALFMVLFSNFDFDAWNADIDPNFRPLSTILLLLHVILLTILLLNLLIAMMGETFQSTKAHVDQVWHMCYAFMILSVEAEMDESAFVDTQLHYWFETDGARWLMTEEVNTTKYTSLFKEENKEENSQEQREKKEKEAILSKPMTQHLGSFGTEYEPTPLETTNKQPPSTPDVGRFNTTFTTENVSRPPTPGTEILHEF